MDELTRFMEAKATGWMFSGANRMIRNRLLQNALCMASKQGFVQVVMLPEEMLGQVAVAVDAGCGCQMYLTDDGAYAYFPVFQGKNGLERFLSLADGLQSDSLHADDICEFIDVLVELEEIYSEEPLKLDENFLKKYIYASAVTARMDEVISDVGECGAWKTKLFECEAGQRQLKLFLSRLKSYFSILDEKKKKTSIFLMAPGERICFVLEADMPEEKQKLLFQMIGWDILNANRAGKRISLTVLEGAKKYDEELLKLLGLLGEGINFNFFAEDIFSGHSRAWMEKILAYFHRFIFTSHTSMQSCGEISKRFGKMQVVHTTRGCDHDRRISSFHMIDFFLGTDRVDHVMQMAPTEEPKYRKEDIRAMPEDACLVQTETYEGYLSLI